MAGKLDLSAAERLLFAQSESKLAPIIIKEAPKTSTEVEKLIFGKSESEVLGVHGSWLENLRDNSPRVVAALKIGIDAGMMLTGNPYLIAYSVFAIIGRLMAITWGTKENQKRVAEQHQADGKALAKGTLDKILRPSEYPVEASSALSVIAESFGVAYGVSKFLGGESGYTPVVLGLVAVWSYANILFGKEKSRKQETKEEQSENLQFAKSKSKSVGWGGSLGRIMKNNPVLTSSLVNVALCIAGVVGGVIEGHGVAYVTAFAIGIVANMVQALLVKKREFNIEGAVEDKLENMSSTHAQKIQAERTRRDLGDLSVSPA